MNEEIKLEDSCSGKTICQEKVELIEQNNIILDRETKAIRDDWTNRFQKDLCCVEYPVKEYFWNWKKLWFSSRVVNKKIEIVSVDNNAERKLVVLILKIHPDNWFNFVVGSKRTYSHRDDESDIRFVFQSYQHYNKQVVMRNKDFDSESYDKCLEGVCAEVAEYTNSFNKGYNARR
jgi:hypothetical protein